jgi:hypothetical protein
VIVLAVPAVLLGAGGQGDDSKQASGLAADGQFGQGNGGGAATLDPRFVGVWSREMHSTVGTAGDVLDVLSCRFITIQADGRFTDKTQGGASFNSGTGLSEGGEQGRVTQRGGVLTFQCDNGRTWTATPRPSGANGLYLDGGEMFLRSQ